MAFPLGLSDPPPVDSTAPDSGLPAWEEITRAGVNYVRNYAKWTPSTVAAQLFAVRQELDAAKSAGLKVWLALAGIDRDHSHENLLDEVVDSLKGHPGLGAWKGVDEPALGRVPPAGLVAVYKRLHALDPAPGRADRSAARAGGDGRTHDAADRRRGEAVRRGVRRPRRRHLPGLGAAGPARGRAARQ